MIGTEDLENIILKCSITKEVTRLPDQVYGYYYGDTENYIILINQTIIENNRLYRSVLAEEIGHHMTTIGDITPRKYMHYRDRLTVGKQELLALKWAADYLIPTNKLLEAIGNHIVSNFTEIMDFFEVSEQFLYQKLEFMAKQCLIWDIDEKRSLHLYHLPSVYICEKM